MLRFQDHTKVKVFNGYYPLSVSRYLETDLNSVLTMGYNTLVLPLKYNDSIGFISDAMGSNEMIYDSSASKRLSMFRDADIMEADLMLNGVACRGYILQKDREILFAVSGSDAKEIAIRIKNSINAGSPFGNSHRLSIGSYAYSA